MYPTKERENKFVYVCVCVCERARTKLFSAMHLMCYVFYTDTNIKYISMPIDEFMGRIDEWVENAKSKPEIYYFNPKGNLIRNVLQEQYPFQP